MIDKRMIYAGIATLFLGLVIWFTYDFLTLRITGTTPNRDKVATTTPYIRVNFNHDIASIKNASLSGVDTITHIEGKSIRVEVPTGSFVEGSNQTLVLRDVTAKNGRHLDTYEFKFTTKYIDQNKQSEEIQKALVDKSDSGQVEDAFLELPFPMGTTEDIPFYLMATVDPAFERPFIEVTFLEEVKSQNSPTKPQVSNERAEQLYAQVITYIKDKDGTPENYDFHFTNDYLNEKYGVVGG